MADNVTPKRRSEIMSSVRAINTRPEMTVRRLVHSMGYRYRLHRADLPGKPDLVFARQKKVIFVHGCFWHQHADPACKAARLPKSNQDYWLPKLRSNAERDNRQKILLEEMGWNVLIVWECQVKQARWLEEVLQGFLAR